MDKKAEENYLFINVKKEESFQQKENYVKEMEDPLLIENDRLKSDIKCKQEIYEVKEESADICSESECSQSEFNKYFIKEERLEAEVKNEDTHDKCDCAQIEEDNVQNNYIQLITVRTCAGCISGDNVDLAHHTDCVSFETIQEDMKKVRKQQPEMLYQCDNVSDWNSGGDEHVIVVREEILSLTPQACNESDIISDEVKDSVGLKKWTEENMDLALDALQSRSMTLAKASDIYGIPSSTLWKRAHRMGIDTPKSCSVLANKASKAIDVSSDRGKGTIGQKAWTQEDMELALDALRSHNMSLTKAAATYGIPSATLWQRAHRMGIDTPKMESPLKSWTEENLNNALEALRSGTISANKASKAYSIPSSTLYKIARREGIKLTAPFNAAPTTWSPEDLKQALEGIRSGQISVQRASTEFGIPAGTLYGRCKKERIELSRINLTPTPWSEDAMGEALEAVTVGQMSINQAAIQFNIPYSSLYGRFRRGKQKFDRHYTNETAHSPTPTSNTQMMFVPNPQHNQHTTPQQSEQYSPQHHPIYQYLQHNIS